MAVICSIHAWSMAHDNCGRRKLELDRYMPECMLLLPDHMLRCIWIVYTILTNHRLLKEWKYSTDSFIAGLLFELKSYHKTILKYVWIRPPPPPPKMIAHYM